jgi:hypothetical protein
MQQHVALFFPLIAERAGFSNPGREPVFMNVEASQYFVDQILAPRVAEFEDLRILRPRLISQILDSMNKASTSGFALDALSDRLLSAWNGTEPRAHTYQRVQQIAQTFRAFCLEHGVLDFSLWAHVFGAHMLHASFYQDYVAARYRHVLVDNIEEGTPLQHDFISLLLKTCDSALLVEDDPGGYRLFLGADRETARGLRVLCDHVLESDDPRITTTTPSPAQLGVALSYAIEQHDRLRSATPGDLAVSVVGAGEPMKYWTNMVQAVVDRIVELVKGGAAPNSIALIAPFVEDVLRFELQERLRPYGIGVRSLRPSRPLFDHPVTRTLTTWAKLAHRAWAMPVSANELARALSSSIAELDIVRAQLIADAAQRIDTASLPVLDSQALWNRVGMRFRERYVQLQQWLAGRSGEASGQREGKTAPLDIFWQQLFTDVLSQAGFGLNEDLDGARICDHLVTSASAFRTVFEQARLTPTSVQTVEVPVLALTPQPERPGSMDVGQVYVQLLTQGLLAALAPSDSTDENVNNVLLAPAYTYLTRDLRSRYQFWLDINTHGWHERIYQPLTHPYVLARGWDGTRQWNDEDELYANRDMLTRVVGGLAMRCDERIFLAQSQLNVAGSEESGVLVKAIQRVMVGTWV